MMATWLITGCSTGLGRALASAALDGADNVVVTARDPDVLVNNAGHSYRAAVEEATDDQVRELVATNFFGPAALIQAVLPGMREQRSGTIVNISSIGARSSPIGSGYYAASKAALEAMTQTLRKEVAPLGITVIAVEPGAFRTSFLRSVTQPRETIDDYAGTVGARREQDTARDGN
jgi:NAD(P)-dependent dehydrogenase (short-subunit alcohol dehydrogenase family)